MRPIVTLTINPTIDAFCRTDRVIPVRKVRTHGEHYVPGGGGLNASRMIRELGGATVAFYMAGGLTGQALEGMVERTGLAAVRIPMTGLTRVRPVSGIRTAASPVHSTMPSSAWPVRPPAM